MAQPPEFCDDEKREVLVGVQPGHGSRILVVANLLLDFKTMGAHIRPGVGEVFGTQRRVRAQNVFFTRALAAQLFQDPDGNARADNTRLASADSRCGLDARKGAVQVLHDQAQQLGLFCSGESGQQILDLAQRVHGLPRFQYNVRRTPLSEPIRVWVPCVLSFPAWTESSGGPERTRISDLLRVKQAL